MQKIVFHAFIFVLVLCLLTACNENTATPETTQLLGPGAVVLEHDLDISTFEKAMAVWNTYADQAEDIGNGSFRLDLFFASKKEAHIWYFEEDSRLYVTLDEPDGDYCRDDYCLDGTQVLRESKNTNPDGSYETLNHVMQAEEGEFFSYYLYTADGREDTMISKIGDQWSVGYYYRTVEKIATVEEANAIIKAAYSDVDITEQDTYYLFICAGGQGDPTAETLDFAHCNGEETIFYSLDENNYYSKFWQDGKLVEANELRTIDGFHYHYLTDYASEHFEYTIDNDRGILIGENGAYSTFKLLNVNGEVIAYQLSEHSVIRELVYDVVYNYTDDRSTYCHQAIMDNHSNGDHLVFALSPTPDPSTGITITSVTWTQNGVTTYYDLDDLGYKILEIPPFEELREMTLISVPSIAAEFVPTANN